MIEKDYKNQIEALLFASGKLMSIDILLNLTGASGKQVLLNNITRLKQEYEERQSPMMIVEEKDGWKLTVRETYLPLVRKIISETELPKTILETLAIIAWKSPVLQSDVVNIRHNKAYEHVSELIDLGFIRKEQKGRSYMINLTEKFYEYFDVDGSKNIRDVFNKVVGAPPQTKVEDFEVDLVNELVQAETEVKQVSELVNDEKKEEDSIYDSLKKTNEEDEEFSEL